MAEKLAPMYVLEMSRDEHQAVYSALVVFADTKRRASVNHRFSDDVKAAFSRELASVERLASRVAALAPQ